MKTRILAPVAVAALLLGAGLFFANAEAPTKPQTAAAAQPDPRVDKVLEQNEKILKNQEEIIKTLADLREGILQLRRRSS